MSEKQTHTQGPWVVKHDEKGLPFIGVESDPWTYNGTIASVNTSEKDARLIAAAPEMLDALKNVKRALGMPVSLEAIRLLVDEAIHEAEDKVQGEIA